MKIRTQFLLTLFLFGIVLVAISASAIVTNQQVESAREQERMAHNIAQGADELSYLSNDYVIYHESQQLVRWQTRFAQFSRDVAGLKTDDPEQQALISNILANAGRLKEVFESVASAVAISSPNPGDPIDPVFLRVSWSRMAVQSQGLVADASRLAQLQSETSDQFQQQNQYIIFALIAVFGAYLLANYFSVQQRTLKSMAVLNTGTSVIGSGNLDFRIEEKRNDEIGDLSRAFNRMSADLKTVTASKADLEREIAEREQAEEGLRQSEEKYRSLVLSMNEGVSLHEMIYDESGKAVDYRILDINPAYESITGLTLEQAVGKKASELYGTGEPPYFDIYSRVAASGMPETFETHFAPMQKHFSISAFSPGKGRFATVFSDITERKKTEQLKDEFIGMVSHEIKTPLTVIIGALSTANLERISRDEARELLGDAIIHADMLTNIVDNLLELSRSQSNRLVLHKEPSDINHIARDVVSRVQSKAAFHRFKVDIPAGLPSVAIDRLRAERVLHNLVNNAIKYSPDGGEVRIFASRNGDHLTVGVQDEGIGISRENQPRLFQRFQRLETIEGSIQGIGLGLNVCRILVEAHGGRIWVESEPGKGSTFFFTVPLGD